MCLTWDQKEIKKKVEESTINILLLPFPVFCFLKGGSQHCNFIYLWVPWDPRPSQVEGLAMDGPARGSGSMLDSLSSLGRPGCNTKVMVSPPWHSIMPPKASQSELISQLALPWLAVLCFSSHTTSTMHRSPHLLFACPVTPKGMCIHAGSPCHGNFLASGFERESQINHRIPFRQINHRNWWQFEELCKRESCAGTRSPTECL